MLGFLSSWLTRVGRVAFGLKSDGFIKLNSNATNEHGTKHILSTNVIKVILLGLPGHRQQLHVCPYASKFQRMSS